MCVCRHSHHRALAERATQLTTRWVQDPVPSKPSPSTSATPWRPVAPSLKTPDETVQNQASTGRQSQKHPTPGWCRQTRAMSQQAYTELKQPDAIPTHANPCKAEYDSETDTPRRVQLSRTTPSLDPGLLWDQGPCLLDDQRKEETHAPTAQLVCNLLVLPVAPGQTSPGSSLPGASPGKPSERAIQPRPRHAVRPDIPNTHRHDTPRHDTHRHDTPRLNTHTPTNSTPPDSTRHEKHGEGTHDQLLHKLQ